MRSIRILESKPALVVYAATLIALVLGASLFFISRHRSQWAAQGLEARLMGHDMERGEYRAIDMALMPNPPVKALSKLLGKRSVDRTVVYCLGLIADSRAADALLDELKRENWHTESMCAWALAMIGDARAVAPIQDLLKRHAPTGFIGIHSHIRDWDGRSSEPLLIWALGEFRDPRSVAVLLRRLDACRFDRCVNYRMACEDSLTRIGRAAVPELLTALQTAIGQYRRSIVRVLGRIGDARAVEPLIGELKAIEPATKGAAVLSLAQVGGTESFEALKAVLRRPPKDDIYPGSRVFTRTSSRSQIMRTLAERSPDSVGVLKVAVESGFYDSPEIEWAIDEARDPLVDPIPNRRLLDQMAESYWSGYPRAPYHPRFGPQAVEMFLKDLATGKGKPYQAAVWALGEIGGARAIEALRADLSRHGNVPGPVLYSLAKLQAPGCVEIARPWLSGYGLPRGKSKGRSSGQTATAQMDSWIRDPQAVTWAVRTLALLEDRESLPDFTRIAQTPVPDEVLQNRGGSQCRLARRIAIQALGRIGDSRAVEPLMEVLRNGDESLKEAAIKSLGELGDMRAYELLWSIFTDREGDGPILVLVNNALDAMLRIDRNITIQRLLGRFQTERIEFMYDAYTVRRLGELKVSAAAAALKHALQQRVPQFGEGYRENLETTQLLRRAIAQRVGLGSHDNILPGIDYELPLAYARCAGSRSVPLLILVLRPPGDYSIHLRAGALRALGETADRRAVVPLESALHDEEPICRQLAAEALGRIGDRAALPALDAARRPDGDPLVRKAVLKAIEELKASRSPK